MLRLHIVQFRIVAVLLHKLPMVPGLFDTTLFQHNDAVAEMGAGQPVGDAKYRYSVFNIPEFRIDFVLYPGIKGCRRLIQHVDRRVLIERPRYGKPLRFSAGEDNALIVIGLLPLPEGSLRLMR